ncbi:MAG: nucleoside triphosphate pyrophosphohydrolase [Chloroflexi bacterium]|nr:nucleoside triphosphate pyrophosphohydrolase [Chloroflexota bacterium]
MAKITILGLGPGRREHLTLEAWQILSTADEVYLRTHHHPLIDALPGQPTYHSFDDLYDAAVDFESLYEAVTSRIIALGQRPQGVIYAVPGHPMIGEQTTRLIHQQAKSKAIPVEIIAGLSFIEPAVTALGIDGMEGLQIFDATDIAQRYHPPLSPDGPALIAQLYSQPVASDVKLTLMNQYPDDYGVTLVHAAGTADEVIEHLPLYEIDRSSQIAHLTTLYVPPMDQPASFMAFQDVMAHLRAPEGCPWDREQTHQSLRSGLLEETYEVLEALDADDPQLLKEELGDLLLHILFHSQIAVEDGEFYFTEVIQHIVAKLIRRHPHVWGETTVEGARHVEQNWEAIKAAEQQEKAAKGLHARKSQLDGVPRGLPALLQALRLQERAAGVGFDWSEIGPVIAKVREELTEVEETPVSDEFGDLFFAIVNWARWHNIDPESALRETNARFRRRFEYIEARARANGHSMKEMTLAEMDALWDAAKSEGL